MANDISASVRQMNAMHDLDKAKSLLKQDNCSLVVVNHGCVVFETRSSGIRGLLEAVKKVGKELKGSAVADKIVGEAAAQVCAYSRVDRVFAETLSQCGKDVFEENSIGYEYENLVPHILNMNRSDLCPFEKIVKGSKSPEEAYLRLQQSTDILPVRK